LSVDKLLLVLGRRKGSRRRWEGGIDVAIALGEYICKAS
jgi:hypothetical protein